MKNFFAIFHHFFAQKCDICKKEETDNNPFFVILFAEAGIIGHENCLSGRNTVHDKK